ncbi:hypothetical protein C7974DRAFT_23810 [Boeremia exigua]|uniref:uncharacterized protein n=1 Tax=Boeremia exigua TaxID=749465 RepID=UPI001E8E9E63|nr:uncharacterized protein C7974DRAFT_23810 [Boeremia exigua]KAH6644588.1 hypothetical protein C7974DRAFT_23810 [Boeremia exigua]
MAYHRIGRKDDHRDPPYSTPKDDEDDDSKESSTSFVSKQPEETPITYPPEVPAKPTDTPISSSYSPTMPEKGSDYDTDRLTRSPTARPTGPPWQTDDNYHQSSRFETYSSSQIAYEGNSGFQTTSATTTSTRSVHSVSSSSPPNENTSELQNHGADNGPNRGPIYAAAAIAPVVVIVIGILVFCCLRRRRRQRQAVAEHGHVEEMKMRPKPVALPYLAPITPPSPPPAVLPQYSPSTPSSSHPPTASSSQPIILGPIPSGNNGAYLTGMDTSDLISMTSAGGISRQGTVVDRDPFADGRSLEEAPPPYRPSSLPPVSIASTSRNNSVRITDPARMTTRTQVFERSPFDDPEDDNISEVSGPTFGRNTDAMSNVSELSYQVDPVVGRSPF